MDSNNTQDGKQPQIPAALSRRFEDSADFFGKRTLGRIWTLLEGQPFTGSTKHLKIFREDPLYSFDDLNALAPLYNDLIAKEAPTRRERDRNAGTRKRRDLKDLVAVLPLGFAERFPLRIDNRISGPIAHEDMYGPVSCDRTLRPIHLGLIAHLSGLYRHRQVYGDRGMVTPDGKLLTSASKLYWSLVSTGSPGGDGLTHMRRAIEDLIECDMSAKTTKQLHKSRDRTIWGNPIVNVQRLVVRENGELVWADFDSPYPTATTTDATLMFELAPWYRDALDGAIRDLVFFDMSVWRELRPFEARVFVYLQSKRRKPIRSSRNGSYMGLHFFAAGPLLFQLGLTASRRYIEIRDTLFSALLQIHRVVDRYEWITPPRRAVPSLHYFHFYVRLKDNRRSRLRESIAGGCLTKAWLRNERNAAALKAYFETPRWNGLDPPPLKV